MISIIGGFYKELCLYPEWDYHYGSGGRAAAIVSGLCSDVCFYTLVVYTIGGTANKNYL